MDFVEELRNYLEGLSPFELEIEKYKLNGHDNDIPKGWVSIEDHLPMFLADDLIQGYSEYKIKFQDGTESTSNVSDHNTWYYYAKKINITHWFNEL